MGLVHLHEFLLLNFYNIFQLVETPTNLSLSENF